MSQRADYLTNILEKLGSPLMAAVIEQSVNAPAAKNADDAALQDAQKIASLLAKSVQAGIEMGNAADMARAGLQDDSLRVALTALAGPLVADQFRRTGRLPGDADIKRIVTALQAVMSFSENFTPSPDNIERLKTLAAEGSAKDAHQIDIQYIHALIPVINALGAFSFGQPEQKLIMDVAARLTERAEAMGKALLGHLGEAEKKLCELVLLRTLAPLYAASHSAETSRLMAMNEEQRAAQPVTLDNVWKSFELRALMLETLARSLLPGKMVASGGDMAKAPAPIAAAPPPVQTPVAPPPVSPAVSAPTPPPIFAAPPAAAPPAQSAPVAHNPMSMFAKPGAAAPAASSAPIPQMPAEQPAAPAPPAAAPAGSNPMSFFKAPKKDDEA